MKKKSIMIVFILLFCLSLCACGMDRQTGRPADGMDILPETSPMVSPDWNDGNVTDKDGIIGDRDTAAPSASPMPSMTASPSPSPTQSGTMPTTAPSASPKP